MLKINSIYKGWKVLDLQPLPDYKSTGIYLRHEKTGMEIFHLLCDDEENLFAFAFKTLPQDSTGVAHILEHSVLCGSKKYPLKDPFIQLNSQSVKTFLNAMTFPDKTVYPASSMVEADYFNLFSVYGDAVFNPLLLPEIFLQEAHRFEVHPNKKNQPVVSVQGVVYNEMKGNYSSFESVVADQAVQTILPGTTYAFDSGGDPSVIPELTHEQLKEFHKTYYAPANCRLFLYGNIPTEKQIDFLNEQFLDSYPEIENSKAVSAFIAQKENENKLQLFTKPKSAEIQGPSSGEEGAKEKESTILISYMLGESANTELFMEAVLLGEILLGHDGSPLMKAMIDSHLGEDVAPNCGLEGELRYLLFTAGMRGVKQKNAQKLEKVIIQTLENLCKTGISQQDIDSAVMSVDFSHREVRRSHGPYSLVLMRRTLRGWLNGSTPFEPLKSREVFAQLKEKLTTEYVTELIQKLLLDNNHRMRLTVIPSAEYDKKRAALDKKIVDKCSLSLEEIEKQQKVLQDFQQKTAIEQRNLIPHLRPCQLQEKVDVINTEKTTINTVPLFIHNEATNGIGYVEIGIPVDTLPLKYFKYLPFFTTTATNLGFNGMNWADSAAYSAKTAGGMGASLFTSSPTKIALEKEPDNPLLGRSWIFYRVKFLEEKTKEAVEMLFNCIISSDFSDTQRIADLLIEYKNDLDASIIPNGNDYMASRTSCTVTPSKAIDEIWNGLSQIYELRNISDENIQEVCSVLKEIQHCLLKQGLVINITGDDSTLLTIKSQLAKTLNQYQSPDFKCTIPSKPFANEAEKAEWTEELYKMTELPGEKLREENKVSFVTNTQVGFAASSFPSASFGDKESVYESIFAHWFTNTVLWEQIRTVGGAYGAFCFPDSIENCFTFATYRDPEPERSLETFKRCLSEAGTHLLDIDSFERVITGCYSKEVQPRSPASRGFTGFIRQLYGIYDKDREEKLHTLLTTTPEDIQKIGQKLGEKTEIMKMAILCSKKSDSTGKIVILPV
jgi:Zn-dependent M16 (insulinase) family peptidase